MGYGRRVLVNKRFAGKKLRSKVGSKSHRFVDALKGKRWEGRRCFILGGGPSLKDFDFGLIKDELTIGINLSFLRFPTCINYSMDARFFDYVVYWSRSESGDKDIYEAWSRYKGFKVFLSPVAKFKIPDDVYIVDRITKKCISTDLDKGIYGGNNSGFGAIALGRKQIALLGYDLKVSDNRTHWHKGYHYQNALDLSKKLDSFKRCFEEFADPIKELGIEVVNLNPDSGLECFPKMTIDEYMQGK